MYTRDPREFTDIAYLCGLPVADLGFPRGGGANPKGGAPTYYLANFSWQLHENEEILGQRGRRVSLAPPPLDLPLLTHADNQVCSKMRYFWTDYSGFSDLK